MGFHWVHRTKTPTTPAEAEPDKEELPQEAQNAAHALQHVCSCVHVVHMMLQSTEPCYLEHASTGDQGLRTARSTVESWNTSTSRPNGTLGSTFMAQ